MTGDSPLSPRVVLVGSNLLGIHLRHRLAQAKGGHANVRFLTFVDLAEALTRDEYLSAGRREFPADAEELLIGELCRSIRDDSPFAAVRGQAGFHRALRSTFHDLIDAGITSLPKPSRKLAELSRLFSDHRSNYLPRFATTADRILEASAQAERFPHLFGTRTLFTYGFRDLTTVQERLLQSLRKEIDLAEWNDLPPPAPRKPEISAFSAPDLASEGEEVARRLLRLTRERPVPLQMIGILLRNPADDLPPFAEALDRAGIPYYREGGVPLAETRLGDAVTRALALPGSDWNRTDVLRALTSFPFRNDLLTPEIGTAADWDAWTRETFVSAGRDQFLRRLSPRHKPFVSLLRAWFEGLEQIGASESAGSFAANLARWSSDFAEPGEELSRVVETARSLTDLAGLPLPPEGIRPLFSSRLASASLRHGSFERDGLFLGSIVSARMVRFDHLAIPSLAERSFPPPPRPDPILLDFERRNLNRSLGTNLPLKEKRIEEERLLFDLAVSQAGESLLLSYARSVAGDERERYPSPFLLRLIDRKEIRSLPRLRWESAERDDRIDEADWLSTSVAALIRRDPANSRALLAGLTPLAAPVARWMEERHGSRSFGPYDGILPPDTSQADSLSPSEISAYATCPYSYFLGRRVGLSALERPDDVRQLRPLDRGEILHEILFRLFTRLRNEKLLPLRAEDREEIDRRLASVAGEVFSEAEERLPLGPRLLWETERAFLLSDLKALLDAEIREASNFRPEAFEVRFGMRKTPREDERLSTDRPVTVPIPGGTVALRGKIDRVDLSPDGRRARVIDYKTGRLKGVKEERMEGGSTIQLPVYLSALPLFFPKIDLAASEAFFLSTSYGSGFRRVGFSGSTLVARKNDFETILSTVARGIRSGLFPPFPGKQMEHCQGCDFRPICGRSVLRLFERKQDDPAVAPLRNLEEIE